MTFSNLEVAKTVNDNFISTWVNRQPGFHNCDDHAEKRIQKYEYECFATKNFCTFFATPNLDVLHYGSGHQYPTLFLRELNFVLELAPAVLDGRNRYMEDALPEFRALHEAHAATHDKEGARISALTALPKATDPEVFRSRRDSYVEGHNHLRKVHNDLVAKAAERNGPVPLSVVFDKYLFGNGFEETMSGDRNREKPDAPGMK